MRERTRPPVVIWLFGLFAAAVVVLDVWTLAAHGELRQELERVLGWIPAVGYLAGLHFTASLLWPRWAAAIPSLPRARRGLLVCLWVQAAAGLLVLVYGVWGGRPAGAELGLPLLWSVGVPALWHLALSSRPVRAYVAAAPPEREVAGPAGA